MDAWKLGPGELPCLATLVAAAAQVLGLLSFITFLFAIIGVQLFNGAFRQRCVPLDLLDLNSTEGGAGARRLHNVPDYAWEGDEEQPFLWVEQMCGEALSTLGDIGRCGAGLQCVVGNHTPANAFHSFDSFGDGMLLLYMVRRVRP